MSCPLGMTLQNSKTQCLTDKFGLVMYGTRLKHFCKKWIPITIRYGLAVMVLSDTDGISMRFVSLND